MAFNATTLCIHVDDDRGEEVHARDPQILTLAGAVPDLALSVELDGVLQRVVRLALVETDLHPARAVAIGPDVKTPPVAILRTIRRFFLRYLQSNVLHDGLSPRWVLRGDVFHRRIPQIRLWYWHPVSTRVAFIILQW